jgi:hypothetical protein
MKRNARILVAVAVTVFGLGLAGAGSAALLGNLLEFPQVVFDSGNTTISGGILSINSAPVVIRLSAGDAPIFITPAGGFEALNIGATVSASCDLVGGIGGDDLMLYGEVDLGGGDVRSGTLLTGEVTEFGSLDAGATDLYDFRFTVTGGALADLYTNDDLGVLVQSENSTFTGDCSQDSQGSAKGALGAIAPILPANGCTPGYWKQKHHYDSWVGYAPTDDFATVFGRVVPDATDLASALKLHGGGLNALTRHATAALLNASNPDVNQTAYETPADVIAAFQAAYDSGDYETQKNLFEEANEEGCPLN